LLQLAREGTPPAAASSKRPGGPSGGGPSGGGNAGGSGNSQRHRPSSAPALLLRGDPPLHAAASRLVPPGRPAREVELGQLRQDIENKVVHRKLTSLRREGFVTKDSVAGVDVMSDPSLFDLKVLHNSAQRRRTAGAVQRQQARQSAAGSGAARRRRKEGQSSVSDTQSSVQARQLKELCAVMDADTRKCCSAAGLNFKCLLDPAFATLAIQMGARASLFSGPYGDRMGGCEEPSETQAAASLRQHLMGIQPKFAKTTEGLHQEESTTVGFTLKAAQEFLVTVGGSVRNMLEGMDRTGDGWILEKDFVDGMQLVGFGGDAQQIWGTLDAAKVGEMSIGDLEYCLVHGEAGPANPERRPPPPRRLARHSTLTFKRSGSASAAAPLMQHAKTTVPGA